MPRAKNTVETVQITVSTTQKVRQFLEELTRTELYGKNAAETAGILLAEQIRMLRRSGELGKEPEGSPED